MPVGLKRYQEAKHLHFVTFSCHGRNPYLVEPGGYATFESVLEETRRSHGFLIAGYAFMPEHVHLLLSEPPKVVLAASLQVVKQQSSRKLKGNRDHFWNTRYYDFNVFSERKQTEKLRYIHRNPVTRGLVERPEDWEWSSYAHYLTGKPGVVEIDSWWTEQIKKRVRVLRPDEG